MSYAQIQAAARLAQTTLAQHAGMAADAAGNALLNGFPITGVFGSPIVQVLMQPGGASRKRIAVPYSFTKEQADQPPRENQTPFVRTDVTPHITYRIDHVDGHQTINYVLLLVKAGE